MPTVPETYCCHEWNLVTTHLEDFSETEDVCASHTVCITKHTEVPAILNASALQTLFNFPKINWKIHPRPERPNDDLSSK